MKPTVFALLILGTLPCAGETVPPQRGVAISPTAGPEATAKPTFEVPKYTLPSGKVEVGGLFGGNVYSGTVQPNPSLGGEFVLGLPHSFGVFAAGSWNRVFSLSAHDTDVGLALYDIGGGLQWSPFRLGRFDPYLRGGVSWVRLSGGGHVGPGRFGFATDRLGAKLGFGGRVYLTRGYGVLFEVGAIQGPGYTWIGRFSTGLFYQFK